MMTWFLAVSPYVIRKDWCCAVEQWVFLQIKAESIAQYFFNNLIESGSLKQQRTGCFFMTFQHFKNSMVRCAFKFKSLPYLIEKALLQIKINHSVPENNFWACRNTVGLANKVKELLSYISEPLRFHEEIVCARIRAMLPLSVQADADQVEINRQRGEIKLFVDLLQILQKIDDGFKPDKKKREVSNNNMNTGKNNKKSGRKDKKAGNLCPVCKKGVHTRDQCWFVHPELRPKKFQKTNNTQAQPNITKMIGEALDKALANLSTPKKD